MLSNRLEPPGKKSFRRNGGTNYNQIPVPALVLHTDANKIFYKNGLAKFIHRLKLRVHSKISECFLLWEKFGRKESLFDLWDFRFSWYQGYGYTPYFYTIYEGKNPLALLPLWYDLEKKRHEWFGSDWMEDNQFFVKDPHLIELILAVAPQPLWLNTIDGLPELLNKAEFEKDDDKFIGRIGNLKNINQYLLTLEKKHRYNLKRDFLHITGYYNPQIEIVEKPDFSEFENIIRLSKNRFNGTLKNETDLANGKRINTYSHILKNSGIYRVKFVKVLIQGILAAIDLIITYKERYYTLKGANDLERFPGIGNFMVYFELEDAIKNQFNLIDCLQIDYGWKHKYFEGKKVFKFVSPIRQK